MRGPYGLKFASGSPVTVPRGAAGPAEEDSVASDQSHLSDFPGVGRWFLL